MSYGAVVSPWWPEVWIVACGPSARTFDPGRLAGKTVIAINQSYFLKHPQQPILFSADPHWVREQRRTLFWPRCGEQYLAIPLDTYPELADIPGITYLKRSHQDGLSDDPAHLVVGGNSGYAAINLAYLKRAQEIHLVGFDMDPQDGEKYAQWAPRFRTMLPQLNARGVRVINHNLNSFIDAFPKEV